MPDRIEALKELAQRADPTRRLFVSFACNDGRNGLFAGRVDACTLQAKGWELEIEPLAMDGYAFTVDNTLLRFRLHRQWFPFTREKEWYGNWCWNRYEMKRPAAIRLLRAMRGEWEATSGPTLAYEWFNRSALSALDDREPA